MNILLQCEIYEFVKSFAPNLSKEIALFILKGEVVFMKEITLSTHMKNDAIHLLQGLKETREQLLKIVADLDQQDLYYEYNRFPNIASYLLHIAQIELWWMRVVIQGREINSVEKESFYFHEKQEISAPIGKERSYYLARLADARAITKEIYLNLSDVEFRSASRKVKEGNETKAYSPEWVLYHLIDHESYHRGQIAFLAKIISGKREKWEHFNTPYLSL